MQTETKRPRLRPIPNWRRAWRFWSVRAVFIGVAAEVVMQFWPLGELTLPVRMALFGIILVTRFIDQGDDNGDQ